MFLRNILTILKVSSFLCVLATKMLYATNGTHLRHVHTEKPVLQKKNQHYPSILCMFTILSMF
jgi:hypothetical protein